MTETLSDLLRHSAEAVSAPSVDVAARTRRQKHAKLILGAPTHGRASHHGLGRHGFHEAVGCQHLYLAG